MASTPRRRRVKQLSNRLARSQRNRRNETFRYLNQFGKHGVTAFLAIAVIGYLLIFKPDVQITVAPGAPFAFAGMLVGVALRVYQVRRRRR
ncbi:MULTISPECIES: hypothetical protein [unclassified Streptomyces]|uniref:hypothetical protein n=1 Tax=Streptomyces sp. NPDC017949 TaxID=3365020 RepID=UPI0037AD8020